jgi:hypothetical protein
MMYFIHVYTDGAARFANLAPGEENVKAGSRS